MSLPVRARSKLAVLALVLVCTSLPVAHKFLNGLVYDDSAVIRGPLIHQPERLREVFFTHAMLAQGATEIKALDTYRPVAIASFFWDAWLSGEETWSYHLTNLLLHLGCVTLLFFLLFELLPGVSLFVAGFSALFFALSPQLAEAHVWINGRSDPLAVLFGLAAMLVWRSALQSPTRTQSLTRHFAVGALFFIGLLSKEVLLMVTPALLFWPEPSGVNLPRRIRRCVPFIVSSVLYLCVRVGALKGMRASANPTHFREALPNLPVLWIDGLAELLAPTRLYLRSMRDEYAGLSSTQRLALGTACILVTICTLLIRRRSPILAWSVLWYALSLAPATLISALSWPGFGRYLYLPCAGLAFGVCELTVALENVTLRASSPFFGRLLRIALATYLTVHALQLAFVTADYRSNVSLFGAVVRANPSSAYGHGWLGASLRDDGHPEQAIPWLEKALELGGFEARYARSLIRSHLELGHYATAESLARDAVAQSQHDPIVGSEMRAQLMRAVAPKAAVEAMKVLCDCLDFAPDSRSCLTSMEWMAAVQGPRRDEFLKQFRLFDRQCQSETARRAFARKAASLGMSTAQP